MDTNVRIDGAKVRALRQEKSWSQEHLAGAAGLSVRTVQRVESDDVGSGETRLALAAALGVEVHVLMLADTLPSEASLRWNRIPRAAWAGVGIGVTCAGSAIAYQYLSGGYTVAEAARQLGIVCALLGTTLGVMHAVRGARSWTRAA